MLFLRTLFVLLIIWLGLIFAAPLLVASSNTVLKYLGTAIYFFMDPVCHQLPQRSIFLASLPMPVCGRCFFIYSGGAVTVGMTVLRNKFFAWPTKTYSALFSLIVVEFVFNKWLLQTERIYLRYAAGFLLGILLFRLLMESLLHTKKNENRGITIK